jgi:hypothetical protein
MPKVHTIQDEVVFLGIAPSAPDGYPLAIGLGFADSKSMKTVFINPPDKWGLLDDLKRNDFDASSVGKSKNKIIGGIQAIDLISKGLAPGDVADLVFSNIGGRSVYSIFPKEDRTFLGMLGVPIPKQIQVQSAITLFHTFVSPGSEREMQLHTKMDLRYYPRNKSDIRWLIELFSRCQKQGSL